MGLYLLSFIVGEGVGDFKADFRADVGGGGSDKGFEGAGLTDPCMKRGVEVA